MFEFVESIAIEASPAAVWRFLVHVETWWLPSNPEHIRLEIRPRGLPLGVGTQVLFEERVAGVKGEAEGTITAWAEERAATWEGTATYRYLGLCIRVIEGVTWRVEPRAGATQLSARVWARFPSGLWGRLTEWYAKAALDVVRRDRRHARRELEYLKAVVEADTSSLEGAV